MIVDTNEYVLSLIRVLLCCLIRDFLIPLFVWKEHLRSKSYGYRFWFCIITQAALQINLVLFLGFFRICNPVIIIGINGLVYLLILWNYSNKRIFKTITQERSELWCAYREDRLSKYIRSKMLRQLSAWGKRLRGMPVWAYIRSSFLEVLLLGMLLVYNIWFLTRNVMLYHSYQFSDIPVHQSWIYELEHGTLFSDGIYPFGMHAMVYIIRGLFRLNLREILLYAGAYQTVLLMIGLYLLAREIFYAKYSPIAVVLIISFMLKQSRYAASLPQEFGMYAVIGIAYFMIRYLRQDRERIILEGDKGLRRLLRVNAYINRRYLNSETMLLMLCVALVIAYHFYTAIAAILLVLAIGLAYLPRILKKQYFIPLMYCGIMGAVIAVLPILACYAKGIPFQGSMKWATSVIAGEGWKGEDAGYRNELVDKLSDQGMEPDNTSLVAEEDKLEEKSIGGESTGEEKNEEHEKRYSSRKGKEAIKFYYNTLFTFGENNMFGKEATRFLFICLLISAVCGAGMLFLKKTRHYGSIYMAMITYMLLLCTIGAAPELGIVELIESGRASTFAQPFIGIIFMMPVDFILRLLGGIWKNRYYRLFLNLLSAAGCVGIAALIVLFGWYHAFFDIYQSYYNEPEYILRHIKKSFDKYSYTVVSTTDEYYEVLDHGYHTQLSEFVNMVNLKQQAFTFPTEYVFFFVEKRVLLDHFYGPVEVGLQYAAKEFVYLADTKDYYYQRAVLESQAYYWAKKYRSLYPHRFRVYYEDDIYVAYILEQNIYNTYDLRVDYLADYREEIAKMGWR